MASSQILPAENSARSSVDGEIDAARDYPVQEKAVTALLVAKRATAREFGASFSYAQRRAPNRTDAVLDTTIGSNGHIHLTVVTSQRAALLRVKQESPRVVLVEMDSRARSRVRFCRILRNRVSAMAILAVADQRPEIEFDFDGFVPLPLSSSRIAEVIEKLDQRFSNHTMACGPFHLDLVTRTLETPGGSRHMTPKLCALLALLMRRHDEVVSRGEIMQSIWETSYLDDTRTLDVHIRWLRESIEPDPSDPRFLLTERGKGYILRT